MLDEHNKVSSETLVGTPRWVSLGFAGLALLSVASLGIGWNASNRAAAAEQALTAQHQEMEKDGQAVAQRFTQSEEASARLQSDLGVVTDKLKVTQGELTRARAASKKLKEEYTAQLGEVEASVRTELATKASAEEVNTKVGALSGDVNGVRGDLESTRKDLGMARTEFGTLIARNHDEIDQLRRLGERDYHEFNIAKKGAKEKLGVITLELRGVNVKRNQYSVALYADDKRFEKNNRAVNEPIFFYMQGTRQPLELVINSVSKDKITGYLSVPKTFSAVSSGGK